MTSKGKRVYRWTHVTKKVKKMFKPYGIEELQT